MNTSYHYNILIVLYVIIFIYLTIWFCTAKYSFYNFYKNSYPTTDFYVMDRNLLIFNNNNNFYTLEVYQSLEEVNCYLLIINPQKYHFFIENNRIIYHPANVKDNILKNYKCLNEFEAAYLIPHETSTQEKNIMYPTVICHRNLNYLKRNIYTKKFYYKTFNTLQKPFKVVANFLKILVKFDKINNTF